MQYYQNDDKRIFAVIVNQTGRYSILPMGCEYLSDWREIGKTGTRDECLAYIGELMPVGSRRSTDSNGER